MTLEKGTGRPARTEVEVYELPPWLQPTYVLDESDPDTIVLHRADGSFVAAFSARGATREGIRQAAEEDWRQRHPLGAKLHAPAESRSSEQGADPREKIRWEQFLKMERQSLEERCNGQLARALRRALPGESQEKLDQLAEKVRRRAEEGFVEIIREGEPLYKYIEELNPEDRLGRLRAERARMLWLQARLEEKNR